LAGGIAHDFNNILASMMVNITLAKMNINKERKVLAKLNDAEKALSRAKDLTRQLLTFSKGGAPIKSVASIQGLLRDTSDFALSGSNVKCNCNISDELWDVDVDEGQISQVIQNLIINAEQAMPDGGNVHIHAENLVIDSQEGFSLNPGRYIRVIISDKGVGIPQEHLDKVFDPFFTTKPRGSGLGLSTAYSIIKNHNGLIRVESRQGGGTTFIIYLPASNASRKRIEPPVFTLNFGKGNILLMDDEDIILDASGDLLEEMGYEVVKVKDGLDAISAYESALKSTSPFDLVIMDLIVPGGMGGKEALQELLKRDPTARVIASSGYSTDPVMANYQEYGFVGALAKPYKIVELSHILARAMPG